MAGLRLWLLKSSKVISEVDRFLGENLKISEKTIDFWRSLQKSSETITACFWQFLALFRANRNRLLIVTDFWSALELI